MHQTAFQEYPNIWDWGHKYKGEEGTWLVEPFAKNPVASGDIHIHNMGARLDVTNQKAFVSLVD